MQLFFDSVPIGKANSNGFTVARTLLRNKAEVGYGLAWRVAGQGAFPIATQADGKTQMDALEALLKREAKDLVFKYDDGTPSTHNWNSALDSVDGVKCTHFEWSPRPGAQLITFREYSFVFEWRQYFGQDDLLLDFQEQIRFRGGYPAYVINESVNGQDPQTRVTVQKTAWFATQTGTAIGLRGYPKASILAPPIFGAGSPPLREAEYGKTSPQLYRDTYREFAMSWHYEFASATQLATEFTGTRLQPIQV